MCKNGEVSDRGKNRLKQFFLSLAIFFSLSLLFALQSVTINLNRGFPADFAENLLVSLIQWLPWSFLALLAWKVPNKFPLDLKSWYTSIPIHVLIGLCFSLVQALTYAGLNVMVYGFSKIHPARYVFASLTKTTNLNLLTYAVIVVAGQMWAYYQKNKESELRASQLQTQLVQSQLDVLRMQLNPHFLFNTLHIILAQVRKNPQAAESMISLLSDLFRKTLETMDLQEVPLKEELDLLKIFLEIQQKRFEERLEIRMAIDPDTLDIPVPNLILQPIVENAVRHGMNARTGKGSIFISTRMEGNYLVLQVRDSGPGFPGDEKVPFETGLGLRNCHERLAHLYEGDFRLILENAEGGGASATLKLPLRRLNRDSDR